MTDDVMSLEEIQRICWVVLAGLTLGSVLFVSVAFGLSVLAGGIISNISFFISQKDIKGFIESIASTPEPEGKKTKAKQGQKGYVFRFWLRIAIIGVVLFFCIKSGVVNIFGLILGLSTVVIAVMFGSLNMIRHYYFSRRR